MKNLIYVIAVLLMVIWAIVFFGFHTSGSVHLIFLLAVIIIIIGILYKKKPLGK